MWFSQLSIYWLRLRSWTHSGEIKPYIWVCARHGNCLRFSPSPSDPLPLACTHIHALRLSLSLLKKRVNKLEIKDLKQSFVTSVPWMGYRYTNSKFPQLSERPGRGSGYMQKSASYCSWTSSPQAQTSFYIYLRITEILTFSCVTWGKKDWRGYTKAIL